MSAGSDHHGDLPKEKPAISYYWPVTKSIMDQQKQAPQNPKSSWAFHTS